MRAALFLFCVLTATSVHPEESTGTITGTVRYTGVVPPPKKIAATDGSTIIHHDLIVDKKTKGLKFVVITLEDAPAQTKVKNAQPVLMDQREMVFLPRVVAIHHGQMVRFENNDLCNHGVMTTSTVKANQFNLVAASNQAIEHVFETQKRPIMVGCALHEWMRAWVYVLPHPWFAVTDAGGGFRIERVPPGKYTLLLHHADTLHSEKRTVQVVAGKTTDVPVEWTKVSK
jgi:plastocyanin